MHLLKARLRGGQLTKARSGELWLPLPAGFVYDSAGRVVLDPDQGVRDAVACLFTTFERTGSARATVKAFAAERLKFPSRIQTGPDKGTLVWLPLHHHRVLQVLHNPRYAGAFVYGRRRQRRGADGRIRHALQPREAWTVLIPDAHPAYISWHGYEDNLRRLAECAQSHGEDRRASPPREGPALLQGLVICGRCGKRMTVRYHSRRGELIPEYVCQRTGIEEGTAGCARISGEGIDKRIGQLLLETVTPLALEVALAVQAELEGRAAEADALRRQSVERARHAAEQARRRYLAVDPDNRLVAANLEADWNQSLRALAAAQDEYQRQTARATPLADTDRVRIAALATDFPALWSDPRTPQRERKRMVRLLIEDVTLRRDDNQIAVGVRFKAGQATTFHLTVGPSASETRRTPPEVIAEVDRLLDHHTEADVAAELNQRGVLSGTDQPFNPVMVNHIRRKHGPASRRQRLQARGLVSLHEVATHMGVHPSTVKAWRHEGRLVSEALNDKGEHYYQIPTITPRKPTGRPAGTKNRQKQKTIRNDPGGAV